MTKNEETRKAIEVLSEEQLNYLKYYIMKRVKNDEDGVQEILMNTLRRANEGYEYFIADFEIKNYFKKAGSLKEKREMYKEISLDAATSNDSEQTVSETIADEKSSLENHFQQSSQLQLIAKLSENSDTLTKQIIETFLSSDAMNASQVAKKLNLHRATVQRKLHALAKNFSVSKFGDLSDYM